MASEGNKRRNSVQRHGNAANMFQSAPQSLEMASSSADGVLALTGAEPQTPEDDVAQEEVVPVVSTVYDAPSIGERVSHRSSQVWDYIRHMTRYQWLWVGVLLLATILRFWDLGGKPLHHDESMHAFFSLTFARNPVELPV